jgi:hypothetical protein
LAASSLVSNNLENSPIGVRMTRWVSVAIESRILFQVRAMDLDKLGW